MTRGRGPLAGVPLAVKDLFCTEGVPSQSGSRILEGYLPPYTATRRRSAERRRRDAAGKTNQDEFAMGSSTENSAYGPSATRGTAPRARRLLGRQRGGRRRGPCAVGARHGHGRLDPPAGGAVRDRRAETDLRLGLALRHDRLRLLARPGRAADARRSRRGAAARRRWSAATRATRPRCSSRARSSRRAPSASTACVSACPPS